tara:strand:- start:39845 stop:41338 length:1494 start_codon:yes stop_codon:yes gene_type:complete
MECVLLNSTEPAGHDKMSHSRIWFWNELGKSLQFACLLILFSCTTLSWADADEIAEDLQLELQRLQHQIDELKAASVVPAGDSSIIPAGASQYICTPDKSCGELDPAKPPYPTTKITGFFQADAVWFDQSPANQFAVGGGVPAMGDVQDGADFRRTRLAAVGKVWENIDYMIEFDFAFPGRPSFMDVWLDINDVDGANNLRIGQFRTPFGMDGQTSVKELTFMERALPAAFLPFRQIGAMYYGTNEDDSATWALAGFRYPTDTFGGNVGDNGGFGMATRITKVLGDCKEGHGLFHLGGGYSFVDPANDLVQYQNQPEVFVGETGGAAQVPAGVPSNVPPFVNTGLIPTDNVNLFNVELAAAQGSFYAQSEAFYTVVNQNVGDTLTFSGAYAHAGYFLTGEKRVYNRKNGVFGRVKPNSNFGDCGGTGAWEIAGRWSYIDLNDENIQGSRLNDLTAGLNWYLNPYTKFQWNYIHAMLDSPLNGDSSADIFAMRAQVDF